MTLLGSENSVPVATHFLCSNSATGQGQYRGCVNHHTEHLTAASKTTDIKRKVKHIVQQTESLPFVTFCHFFYSFFRGLKSGLYTSEKINSLLLPQGVPAIESCVVMVTGLKENSC